MNVYSALDVGGFLIQLSALCKAIFRMFIRFLLEHSVSSVLRAAHIDQGAQMRPWGEAAARQRLEAARARGEGEEAQLHDVGEEAQLHDAGEEA